jgi:lysophospholipase L1-like esterase
VGEAERWPNQLVARLGDSVQLDLVANLGVNGYSTADLIEDELPRFARLMAQFVTLLIGVNDVVRGIPVQVYRGNVADILDTIVAAVGPNRAVVVSTPDYTLTPQGSAFGDPDQQRAEIAHFNDVMRSMAGERGIRFVDISSVANQVASDTSLVARDGLHPSGAQYARWVDLIAPAVMDALSRPTESLA